MQPRNPSSLFRSRWEIRYSPSEMMYLDIASSEVRLYLHHSPEHAQTWTFAQVIAGEADRDIRINSFTEDDLLELKAAVARRMT